MGQEWDELLHPDYTRATDAAFQQPHGPPPDVLSRQADAAMSRSALADTLRELSTLAAQNNFGDEVREPLNRVLTLGGQRIGDKLALEPAAPTPTPLKGQLLVGLLTKMYAPTPARARADSGPGTLAQAVTDLLNAATGKLHHGYQSDIVNAPTFVPPTFADTPALLRVTTLARDLQQQLAASSS
jgi:hypothetical protein